MRETMKAEAINKIIPDFSGLERRHVPTDVTWKLTDIYRDETAWTEDKKCYFQMIQQVEPLAKEWTTSAQKMVALLQHVSQTQKKENQLRGYASLASDTNMGDSHLQEMEGEITTASVNLETKLAFREPDIIQLGQEKINEYIKAEPDLEVYRMYFENVLHMKDHILTTDKESILAQTDLFSETPEKASGILNDVDMPAPTKKLQDGTRIALTVSNYILFRATKDRKNRANVIRSFWKHRSRFQNTHAALLDGAVKNHFFNASVRHYNSCLEASLFPRHIQVDVYHNLIETVEQNLAPLHRYMKFKARLLGLKQMSYDDIYASAIPAGSKTFTIKEAKRIVQASLKPLGQTYGEVLENALNSGWMDIYANRGKRSGAYSNGSVYDVHPYVLMNYNGTLNHVSTLAHEFGHALHSWFSNKAQPFPVARYPIFLAEVASTFNETLLVHYMSENETDDLFKLYILDHHLDEIRGTLYRQSLFAHFELDIHQRVEQGQTLTAEWLNQRYLELTRQYYGHQEGVTQVDKYIEAEWSIVHHFYYGFYVYQYSTGIAAALTLADMVLKGQPGAQQRYLEFLQSGGTRYPLDALARAGVNLTTPRPIQLALNRFDETISQMETILKRMEK